MGQGVAPCSSKEVCSCLPEEKAPEIDTTKPGVADGQNGPVLKLPVATSSASRANPEDDVYWERKHFDFEKNTEDVYAVAHFTGSNKDIRPLLDYTYHKKYAEERVKLQDRIIRELCASGTKQEDLLLPWVVFTAGAMGAGKGFVTRWLAKQGCFPLEQCVIVDPDEIRQKLPEWNGYVKKDPMQAAMKTQKEAGHIAEILGYKALRSRWNVVFDGSLRDVEWYKIYFQKLRYAFPGIRLMILHIQADREAVLQRAEERGYQTGRMVPRQLLESSMEDVPKSVEALAPYVDVAIRAVNLSEQDPKLEREPTAVNPPLGIPITCEYIKKLWMPIDTDGDGQLSKSEVLAALAQGLLTEAVLDTIDIDGDGAISKEELKLAIQKCYDAGSVQYRNPSMSFCEFATSRSLKWGATPSLPPLRDH